MNKDEIISIVLTGGPCAGKSESISELKKFLSDLQYRVITIPELATETRQNGFIHTEGTISQVDFQKIIFEMQLFKENLYKKVMSKSEYKSKMVLLLDRGLLDGKVYLTEKEFKKLLDIHGLSENDILGRYSAVFHLESTAIGNSELYNKSSNKFRLSNPEQAKMQEKKSIEVWSKHPNFHFISVEKDFETKIQNLKESVLKEIQNENIEGNFTIEER